MLDPSLTLLLLVYLVGGITFIGEGIAFAAKLPDTQDARRRRWIAGPTTFVVLSWMIILAILAGNDSVPPTDENSAYQFPWWPNLLGLTMMGFYLIAKRKERKKMETQQSGIGTPARLAPVPGDDDPDGPSFIKRHWRALLIVAALLLVGWAIVPGYFSQPSADYMGRGCGRWQRLPWCVEAPKPEPPAPWATNLKITVNGKDYLVSVNSTDISGTTGTITALGYETAKEAHNLGHRLGVQNGIDSVVPYSATLYFNVGGTKYVVVLTENTATNNSEITKLLNAAIQMGEARVPPYTGTITVTVNSNNYTLNLTDDTASNQETIQALAEDILADVPKPEPATTPEPAQPPTAVEIPAGKKAIVTYEGQSYALGSYDGQYNCLAVTYTVTWPPSTFATDLIDCGASLPPVVKEIIFYNDGAGVTAIYTRQTPETNLSLLGPGAELPDFIDRILNTANEIVYGPPLPVETEDGG